MIGETFGNYRITRKIGEGGMGEVYRGVDLMLEREVAIKLLRPELARQPQVVERFRGEAVTLAKLNHPHIATLYSFLRHDERHLMVMEFVSGLTVAEIIGRQGAMPCEQALPLLAQALDGLGHAHCSGIIHRDLKPSNLMVSETGAVKLMDFGIARVLGAARMTREGRLIGTIEYMSPEQIRGLESDARSDIYSLGIVFYEMLSGRAPFQSNSDYELMRSQIEVPPPPPREFAPGIPEGVERVILQALAKEPAERFQSAGEFRDALINGFGAENFAALKPGVEWINFDSPQSTDQPEAVEMLKETRLSAGSTDRSPFAAIVGLMAHPNLAGEILKRVKVGAGSLLAPLADRQRLASLFEKLDWRHYLGAASALMTIIGLLLAVIGIINSKPQSTTPKAPVNTPSGKTQTAASPAPASSGEQQGPAPQTQAASAPVPSPSPEPSSPEGQTDLEKTKPKRGLSQAEIERRRKELLKPWDK
jgi:serine/threonine-protein kinase